MNWYDNHANLLTLCRFLVEHEDYDAGELLPVLAEPWKWQQEFEQATRWYEAWPTSALAAMPKVGT